MYKAIKSDITRGFGILMNPDCAQKLKDAEIYPMGLQHQWSINEKGETIPKKRVSHDLSNKKKTGLSINQRVIDELMPEVLFGYTLLRFLHLIHHIRYENPDQRILMNKVDIEKAYRRLHVTGETASKCIALWYAEEGETPQSTKNTEVAIALNRLPFGSKPAPAEFSNCSDITFDLANDLMHCNKWNPLDLKTPLSDEIPPPNRLPKDAPFGKAAQADISLPNNIKGGVDGYIDDGATVVLDTDDNQEMVKRAEQCMLMSLYLQFRPHAGKDEPIDRGEMASIPKLKAEAYLSETMIFLGWFINTRSLTISLPEEKHKAWSDQISIIQKLKKINYQEISKLVGRLNHVAFIIPTARHFMNRLRRIETQANKHRWGNISPEAKEDLILWQKFLLKAKKGISINNIIFRTPTSTSLSDSSEFGIGGYGHTSGIMWRYEFTTEEQTSFDINQKEYIASAINQKIQLEYDHHPFPCSNDITDNTSTASWMNKSNFDPNSHPINNAIARWNAENLIRKNASCYSQYLPGSANDIADSLSRDFHLTNEQLIALFNNANPPYLPKKQMEIIKLPVELTSWIASLAQLQPKKRELNWGRTPSTLARGIIGWHGSNSSEPMIPIFSHKHPSKKYEYSAHSCTPSEEVTSIPTTIKLKAKPRKRPSIMWQRPSSQVVGSTPD